MAINQKIPIKFFTLGSGKDSVKPITDIEELVFEDELKAETDIEKFKKTLSAMRREYDKPT